MRAHDLRQLTVFLRHMTFLHVLCEQFRVVFLCAASGCSLSQTHSLASDTTSFTLKKGVAHCKACSTIFRSFRENTCGNAMKGG